MWKEKERIYLDYAATTPVDPAVRRAMEPYFARVFGNPGSLHRFGQEASAAVFAARRAIADAIGARHDEIVFTGSATEANNLALRGAVAAYIRAHPRFIRSDRRPRIIVSAIEHESILETARDLERDGAEVVYLPISREGIVDLKKLARSINNRTVLVSIQYANNEVGTIQPMAEIANIVRNFKSSIQLPGVSLPVFHTDAAQALQFLDCGVTTLGADLMTLSSHKVYGPK